MPTYKLEELRFPQLDTFDKSKTLFTVVVSPLEEHGPHLPLGTDAFNAEYLSDEISRCFLEKYPDWNIVKMPTLYIGSFAFDAVGSVIVHPRTIKNLLIDYLSSLAKYGFQYFLVSNAHGGPTHIVALEEATRIVSRRYNARAVSFTGHLIWKFLRGNYWPEILERLQFSEEDANALKEDAHAGQWETSMMLKLRPELVDPQYKTLDPFTVKMIERIRPNYPMKKGNKLGYVGHPARASQQLAEVSSRFLLEKAFELIEEHLLSQKAPPSSVFYRLPLFRTNFAILLLALAVLAGVLLWLAM